MLEFKDVLMAITPNDGEVDQELYGKLIRLVEIVEKYFRATIVGHENLPKRKGALLVANHGIYGYDSILILKLIFDNTGRTIRALGDHAHFKFPIWRDILSKIGVVQGTPENAVKTLQDNEIVLVFPGGVRDMFKGRQESYELKWQKSTGFARVALKARRPIIPLAAIGPDDALYVVKDREEMKETFVGKLTKTILGGDKYVMPLALGLGPLPLPVKFTYHVGRPISLKNYYGGEDDPVVIKEVQTIVKNRLNRLLARGLKQRKTLFGG